jgi:hypothetical protein
MTERRVQTESELVELVRGIDVPAPQRLHDRVQELVDERVGARDRRPRLRITSPLGALTGAAAAAAVAVAIVLATGGGGTHSAPGLATASTLALAGPTSAAPAEDPANHRRLAASVDGVAFPYWEESLGWRTVGARADRVGGRDIRTVYYANAAGRRIGYAIVGGTPPATVSGGRVWRHDGTDYRLLRVGDAEAVVWLRGGRLCVVSGRGVQGATLLRLASWGDRERVA